MKCINCECQVIYSRGICRSCYMSFKHLVQKERTTWKELEELNLVDAPRHSKAERLLEQRRKERAQDK